MCHCVSGSHKQLHSASPASAPCAHECLPSMAVARFLNDIVAEMVLAEVEPHPLAPRMPRDDLTNSTLACLPFAPRAIRRLESVLPISRQDFGVAVEEYVKSLPNILIASHDQSDMILPSPGIPFCPRFFRSGEHVETYSYHTLNVVSNILSQVDASIVSHDFDAEKNAPMHCGWTNRNWGRVDERQHYICDVRMVTVTMPGWCFANQDMVDFTAEQDFLNLSSLEAEDLDRDSAARRLWARLQDFCSTHEAHHFIVNTYNQWAFGMFSPHWTRAFVTPPMKFNASGPNIVQSITFWMHSSYGHPKGYQVGGPGESPRFTESPLCYHHRAVLHPLAASRLSCCS